jgi:hypothetical protein
LEEYKNKSDLPLAIKSKVIFVEPVKQNVRGSHYRTKERQLYYKELANIIQTTDGVFVEV